MKLVSTQIDEMSLVALGKEASAMLLRQDFSGLAERFGYAVAFDRAIPAAIEADFRNAVGSPNRTRAVTAVEVDVKFFAPNDCNLCAAVECLVPVADGAYINLELIVTGVEAGAFVTLEDVSGFVP